MIRRLFTLILPTFILAVAATQASIVLSPPVQEISIYRGKPATFTINATNRGNETESVRFEVKNMDITRNGRPFANDSTYDRGCADWITLDPPEATLEPMQQITITGTMDVPREIDGSYYAMFLVDVSQTKVDMEDGNAGFNIRSQAGVVLMAMPRSGRNRAILNPDTLIVYPIGEAAEKQQNVLNPTSGWEIVFGVKNDGNIHTRAKGDLSLWSSAGVRLETVPLLSGQGYIMPDRVREFRAQGSGALVDGYYVMSFNLRTREGRTITDNIPFALRNGEVFFNETVDETEELLMAAMPRFRLREPIVNRKLSPGGESYMAFNLQNVSDDTLVLHPEKKEWFIDPLGYSNITDGAPLHGRSCTSWIELLDDEVVLLPKRSVSVKAKVHTPEDATEGEYYAAITFKPEGVNPELLKDFEGERTQLLILSGPSEGDAEVQVDTVFVQKRVEEEQNICEMTFAVKNLGTKYCYADGNITIEKEVAPGIYDLFTDQPEFGGRDAVIMPNSERGFSLSLPGVPEGKYRAILYVRYDTEEGSYITSRVFTM